MTTDLEITALIDQAIARLNAEVNALEAELQVAARRALEDWLLTEACKDYDTIELDDTITGKARRKNFKALRDKKRNTEKMITALQDLRETVVAQEGEKLRKKFEAEVEKYQ